MTCRSYKGLVIEPADEHGRLRLDSICLVHFLNEPSPGERANCVFHVDEVRVQKVLIRVG